MIKNINCTSQYLTVTGGTGSPFIGNNGSGAGMIKFNNTSQSLEVFDGNNWIALTNNYASIEMSGYGSAIMQWAAKKMEEERELDRIAAENITIQELYNEIKEKQNQIKMIQTLIKNDETVT